MTIVAEVTRTCACGCGEEFSPVSINGSLLSRRYIRGHVEPRPPRKRAGKKKIKYADTIRPDAKMCTSCLEWLPYGQFRRRGERWGPWCKACHQKCTLMNKYKITSEQYDALMQIKTCSICGSDGEGRALHIDHDHETHVVRGMLCGGCNAAIGLMKEDPDRLRAAALYVETHRKEQIHVA